MKYLFYSLIISALLFTSCSEEEPMLFDFSGEYIGTPLCTNDSGDAESEELTLIITKTLDQSYTLDFGDETIFTAEQLDNTLIINEQTLNADGDFDVVTMAGVLEMVTPKVFEFDFTFEVDDEGSMACESTLNRS